MVDMDNLNSDNIDKNIKEQNNSIYSNATQNETKEEKSKEEVSETIKKKDSKSDSPIKKPENNEKVEQNKEIKTQKKIIKNKKGQRYMISTPILGPEKTEENFNSNNNDKNNSNETSSKEEAIKPEENNNGRRQEIISTNPIIKATNVNIKINSSNINTNNITTSNPSSSNINFNNNINNSNSNNNSNFNTNNFLGKKHYPEKSTHLLADVIMKKEFQVPQKKVIIQKNPNSGSKTLDLYESDSEDDKEGDEENDEDEEYDINDGDDINKKKRRQIKSHSDSLDSKDKENNYYKDLKDLVDKNSFDKVLECTFKIYNHEFSIKGTNGKDYAVLKKINDISNKINKESFQTLLIKILSNAFKETQLKLLDLIYKTKDFDKPPEVKPEIKTENINNNINKQKPTLPKNLNNSSVNNSINNNINNKSLENNKEKEKKEKEKEKKENEKAEIIKRILENEENEENEKNQNNTRINKTNKLHPNISTAISPSLKNKSKLLKRNNSRFIHKPNNNLNDRQHSESQPPKRRHQKKPSPPFYFGKHFYKKNNRVYCYVPKAKTASFNHYTLYCINRGSKDNCKAKIIIQQNDSKTVFIGNHTCHPKLSVEDFYVKYPDVKHNDDWTHVQFAVRNDVPFIISQY